jgi:hypothetical protein
MSWHTIFIKLVLVTIAFYCGYNQNWMGAVGFTLSFLLYTLFVFTMYKVVAPMQKLLKK